MMISLPNSGETWIRKSRGHRDHIVMANIDFSNFMTALQTQQSLDLAFDDSSSFDMNSEILQFTNLDDSIIIDPYREYNDFGLR
jgi:hypothetical protein